MRVESQERSAGMGAVRYTAILFKNEWVRVSRYDDAQYHGRINGEEHYSVEVADSTITADFYRSNSGNEYVTVREGDREHSFRSFDDAHRWADAQVLRPDTVKTCPHCGGVL